MLCLLVSLPLVVAVVGGQGEGTPPAGSAAPTSSRPENELLVLRIAPGPVEPGAVDALNAILVREIDDQTRLSLVTASDIEQLVDLEAERALLNCDKTSCLAELAGAFGMRYVLFGQMSKLGSVFILELSVFDSVQARPIAREVLEADDLGDMRLLIRGAVSRMFAPFVDNLPVEEAEPAGVLSWVLLGAGSGALVFGLVVAGVSGLVIGGADQLVLPSPDLDGGAKAAVIYTAWGATAVGLLGVVVATAGAGSAIASVWVE